VTLGVFLLSISVTRLVRDSFIDGNWTRMAFVATLPILLFTGLFFFQAIFGNLFQLIGPIGSYHTNSRFYSPRKPSLRRAYQDGMDLPHVTIQMPVYREGLEGVIKKTVRSLQAAISHYESRGGTANIIINDDGLRAGGKDMTEEDVQARKEFYHDNNIGWVARPKHGDEGFERKGKFKKASNMNFALNLSMKVEEALQEMVGERARTNGEEGELISEEEEDRLYTAALEKVLQETPRAQAAGNIRVGEIVLLVDSDTRVVSLP
jgi:cellulose synthase/poly-beta-1,6-N-acetylglucosamine synthase-like glycosyltransferase